MYKSLYLIYPPYNQIYSKNSHKAFLPQLGILELLSSIKDLDIKSIYIDVQCETDQQNDWLFLKVKVEELTDNDVIGFYTQTSLMPWIKSCVEDIRKINSKVVIIAGGPYVTGVFLGKNTSIQKSLCLELFNVIFTGEAEKTLREFIINYKTTQRVFVGDRLKTNEIKFPLWEKAEDYLKFYRPAPNWVRNVNSNSLPVLFSRGCRRSCSFCMTKCMWDSKLVEKQMGAIETELQLLHYKFKIDHLQIWGDDFLLVPNYADIAFLVCKYGMSYSINTHPTMIDSNNATLLKKTGCTNVLFGVESLEFNIQKSLGKVLNPAKLVSACELLKINEIYTTLSFIIGFPIESEESIFKIKQFILSNKELFQFLLINILSLHPGTTLYEKVTDSGLINESDLVPNSNFKGEPYALLTTSKISRNNLQKFQEEILNLLL